MPTVLHVLSQRPGNVSWVAIAGPGRIGDDWPRAWQFALAFTAHWLEGWGEESFPDAVDWLIDIDGSHAVCLQRIRFF